MNRRANPKSGNTIGPKTAPRKRLVAVAGKVDEAEAEAVTAHAESTGVTRSVWVATAVRERLARLPFAA